MGLNMLNIDKEYLNSLNKIILLGLHINDLENTKYPSKLFAKLYNKENSKSKGKQA